MIDENGMMALTAAISGVLGAISTFVYSYFSGREKLTRVVDERVLFLMERQEKEISLKDEKNAKLEERTKHLEAENARLTNCIRTLEERIRNLEEQLNANSAPE